ncbi:MAG: hypothetical protein M1838_005287 [Thelocarpon superellum]|nr:MAG: hypothetical protein M1838_005287 [Thelocarpon superellum]
MTRPQIIRADTIDLQDHDAPSAQDHSRQPTHPAPLGLGPPSPHQAGALRKAGEETADEQRSSPRMSWQDGERPLDEGQSLEHGLGSSTDGSTDDTDEHEEPILRQNGNLMNDSGEDGDLADGDDGDGDDDDDMMDKISSSPSIDDEDIDFEFVYALHQFVATVEGQANATKGETMVLLDDSNSYWWLVRVVKDGSIGYLPAEHIETPTERLARLNKHRNIDLSATMLGDNPEKSKNPLKKAMRRRNAKTVQFSAPKYYEASDIDYSTEEEEEDEEGYANGDDHANAASDAHDDNDEITAVEPLRPRNTNQESKAEGPEPVDATASDAKDGPNVDATTGIRASEEGVERPGETIHKTRNGTVRNTDSFFKDDNVETRKITLTPNLLRDDSSGSTIRSIDSKEVGLGLSPLMGVMLTFLPPQLKSKNSLDNLERVVSPPERNAKDDIKRKKEKKPGMLSGLFKRKDKKSKSSEDDLDDAQFAEKLSEESRRYSPVPKASEELSRSGSQASLAGSERSQSMPPKSAVKLQKAPPNGYAANKDAAVAAAAASERATSGAPPNGSSLRVVDRDAGPRASAQPAPLQVRTTESKGPNADVDTRWEASKEMDPTSPLARTETKVDRAVRTERGLGIDTSPDTVTPRDSEQSNRPSERLSESPVEVSPVEARHRRLPPLMVDSSSQEDASVSPVSPSSSPEMVDALEVRDAKAAEDGRGHGPASSTPTPTWSDASLRTYLEDDNDIRDLLIVVHDKSGVEPAGPDHPLMGGLFKEENARLADITTRLDGLLGDWMARRGRTAAIR